MVTAEQIDAFAQFARARIEEGTAETSLVELVDEWLLNNPLSEDWLAIQASLQDLEAGETGAPFEQFAAEFRDRNGLSHRR